MKFLALVGQLCIRTPQVKLCTTHHWNEDNVPKEALEAMETSLVDGEALVEAEANKVLAVIVDY